MGKHMGLHITHTRYLFQYAVRTNDNRKRLASDSVTCWD